MSDDNWRAPKSRVRDSISRGRRPSSGSKTKEHKPKRRHGWREPRFRVEGNVDVDVRRRHEKIAHGKGELQNVSMQGALIVVIFPKGTSIDRDDHLELEVTSGPFQNLVIGGHIRRFIAGPDDGWTFGVEFYGVSGEDAEILIDTIRSLVKVRRKKK